ncbi:MAG: alpha/beta fold hydrolase [Coprococcus sp.]
MHLCGLSLGGILALQYALEHPQKVASVVLIGTQYTMPKRLREILKNHIDMFRISLPRSVFQNMGL